MRVELVDLAAQHRSLCDELEAALRAVIVESAFVRGPYVERFEQEWASKLGVPHCVSCGNGTDALMIALRCLELELGDEVITTAHSWIATSEAITQMGGRVVFADTQERTFNIDPESVEAKITPRTRGLIPVHLFGQPADMNPIMDIARRHGLWVVEDCAQAHGAVYEGRPVGTIGDVGTFSFYPGKNLGALGDAGCLVTRSRQLAELAAAYSCHGGKGVHAIEGINSRLDGLQAAVLSVKLRYLDEWTSTRQRIAADYVERLTGVGDLVPPEVSPGRSHMFHLFVVQTEARDDLRLHLAQRDVSTGINYPRALPFYPCYARLGHVPEDFPVAYRHQSRVLSLPMYPEMTAAEFDYVIAQVRAFFEHV